MVAHPLSRDHGEGSEPSVEPPVWANVNQRRKGKRLYVLGHLMSEKLGGPGDDVRNLTPITFSANALHRNRVEEKVEDLVDHTRPKKMVHYEVEVDYPSDRSRVPRYKRGEGHDQEGLLARKLTARWCELKMKGPNNVEPVGSMIEKEIENVPPYPNED